MFLRRIPTWQLAESMRNHHLPWACHLMQRHQWTSVKYWCFMWYHHYHSKISPWSGCILLQAILSSDPLHFHLKFLWILVWSSVSKNKNWRRKTLFFCWYTCSISSCSSFVTYLEILIVHLLKSVICSVIKINSLFENGSSFSGLELIAM